MSTGAWHSVSLLGPGKMNTNKRNLTTEEWTRAINQFGACNMHVFVWAGGEMTAEPPDSYIENMMKAADLVAYGFHHAVVAKTEGQQ